MVPAETDEMPEGPVRALIERLELSPHPEGGWYRETYRAAENIPQAGLPERFSGDRPFATAISATTTPAPSAANRSAMARPIPLPAPVTIATLSFMIESQSPRIRPGSFESNRGACWRLRIRRGFGFLDQA